MRDNVYTVTIVSEYASVSKFKASGAVVDKLAKQANRWRPFRGNFKLQTEGGSALIVDLDKIITIEFSLYVDNSDATD